MNTSTQKLIMAFAISMLATTAQAESDATDTSAWPLGMQIAYQGDQALVGIQTAMQNTMSDTLDRLLSSSMAAPMISESPSRDTDNSLQASETILVGINSGY